MACTGWDICDGWCGLIAVYGDIWDYLAIVAVVDFNIERSYICTISIVSIIRIICQIIINNSKLTLKNNIISPTPRSSWTINSSNSFIYSCWDIDRRCYKTWIIIIIIFSNLTLIIIIIILSSEMCSTICSLGWHWDYSLPGYTICWALKWRVSKFILMILRYLYIYLLQPKSNPNRRNINPSITNTIHRIITIPSIIIIHRRSIPRTTISIKIRYIWELISRSS